MPLFRRTAVKTLFERLKMAEPFVKDDVLSLIKSDSDRVTYQSMKKNWTSYQKVLIDGKYSHYVKCTKCTDIYIVKYKTGTNGISTHDAAVHGNVPIDQPTIEAYTQVEIKRSELKSVYRASAACCALDLIPLSFTENDGMKMMIDAVTKLCHTKKQRIHASEILPSHTTNVKYVQSLRDEIFELMVSEMASKESIHTTCDHWSEDYSNRNFFTATAHFISTEHNDDDNKDAVTIKSCVLGTKETSCKTAKQITEDYDSVIKMFKIGSKIKSVTTDSASANKSAFKFRDDIEWYSCKAHDLNTTLKHSFTFKDGDSDYDHVIDVYNAIHASKQLVTYAKHSGLNANLIKTLKQSVDTRWDSTLEQLESISKSFDQLKVLAEHNSDLQRHIMNINIGILNHLIALLIPFRTARKKLCKNGVPTFNQVAVIKQGLLKDHLKECSSDLSMIKFMKIRLRKYLCEKFGVSYKHMIASFLTPGLKNDFMSNYHEPNLVKEAKSELISLCKDICIESDDENETPAKQRKVDDIFSQYYKPTNVPKKYQSSEVERYQTMIVTDVDVEQCPLEFWSRNNIRKSFPKLSMIAIELISTPATSVKSEQNFSSAGRLINDRRSNMTSDNIDALLFVRSNKSYIKI